MKNAMRVAVVVAIMFSGVVAHAGFVPPDGNVIVFVGQDNASVGGNGAYTNGYVDNIGVPGGITHYVYFTEGWTNGCGFAFDTGTVDGLNKETTWGAGPMCMKAYLESPVLARCLMHLSISMEGNSEDKVADGSHDFLIAELAAFLAKYPSRTFLLRIGYEFDGSWNNYDPVNFKAAFRRIVDKLREAKVKNFVTVLASSGMESAGKWADYYPGEGYVDWVGYSYFRQKEPGREALAFARKHQLPVFIAEATPKGTFLDRDDGEKAWADWYEPFFRHVERNRDVIRAISYINCNWDAQPMWKQWGNSRLEENRVVREKWLERLKQLRRSGMASPF